MRKIKFILCSLLVAFILFCCNILVNAEENSSMKVIKVGYMNNPGYIEQTSDGDFIGYGVEYLEEISKYTNWKIEYVYASWKEQLEKLENGEIDIVTLAQYSEERAEKFIYSHQSIGLIQGVLMTLPETNITCDALSLNGKKIGVLKESLNSGFLSQYATYSGFTYDLYEYDFPLQLEEALYKKEVDIIACEQMSFNNNLKLLDRFVSDPYYIITSKANIDLMNEIDFVISKINAYDQNFQFRLQQKYFGNSVINDKPYFTKKEIEYINNHDKVTFAFIQDNQPLSFLNDLGEAVGIIPDILEKISKLCDIDFDYVYIPKDQTPIEFLKQNKSCFGTGMLKDNKAFKQEAVLLSDVYYTSYASLISNSRYKDKQSKATSFKIGVPRSFQAMHIYIKEECPDFEIVDFTTIEDGLKALESGEIDYFTYSINLLYPYLSNPIYGDLYIADSKFLPCQLCTVVFDDSDNKIMIDIFNKCAKMISSADIYQLEIDYLRDSLYVFDDRDVFKRYQPIILIVVLFVSIVIATYSITLVIRQRKYNKDLSNKAQYDFITGLLNRATMDSKIIEAMEKNRGKSCSLLLIDIDDLSRINDMKGHLIGDEVIKKVAEIIKEHFKGSAILGRVGGDDFAVFLMGMESKSILVSILSKLQRTIAVTSITDASVSISVSIGIVMFYSGDLDIDEVYRRANVAKAFVKNNDKNGFAFYSTKKTISLNPITRDLTGEYIENQDEQSYDDVDSEFLSKINYTNSQFEKLINNFPNVALYVIDQKSHKIIYYNKRFKQICPKAKVNSSCRGIMFGLCDNCIVDTMKEQKIAHTVFYSDAYGDEIEITATKVMWDDTIPAIMLISWPRNISQDSNDRYQRLSSQDSFDYITGGYNRQGFIKSMERMRNGGVDLTKYAVLFINVQDFKAVNELVGNDGGDNLLHTIVERVDQSELQPVLCSRKESDHFIFLVEKELLDLNILSRLLNFHWNYNEKELFILCRCGIFMIEDPKLEIYKMIDRAKLAKEHIVDEYIKPYEIFNGAMLKEYSDKAKAFLFFDQGMKNNEFVVYYQPIVDTYTQKIVSAEALVRRISQDGQITSPGKFISVFEKTGYISKLDKFVGRKVRDFQKTRKELNLFSVPISFNLSQMDFYDKEFIEELTNAFESGLIPKDSVMIEVTESAYTLSEETHETLLHHLHDTGVNIYLDDFGTGYSSFGMFEKYYFNRIKLDMSFVRQLTKNKNVVQVVKAIILMCHKLDIKVVAEGVETEDELLILKKLGCDYVQGFYFSKPLDEKSFIKYLEENK